VTLPERYITSSGGWLVRENQVLINLTAQSLEGGFIGRVCMTSPSDAGMLNQRIGRFFLESDVIPEFFFRCLQTTRFRKLVENRCEGSKVRHLYFSHFAEFLIPMLDRTEQQRIVEHLRLLDESRGASWRALAAVSALRRKLTNSIIGF